MRKLLYSVLSLFVVWFASTACFPIYVGTSRPELTPCPEPTSGPNGVATPCVPSPTPTPAIAPEPVSSKAVAS